MKNIEELKENDMNGFVRSSNIANHFHLDRLFSFLQARMYRGKNYLLSSNTIKVVSIDQQKVIDSLKIDL